MPKEREIEINYDPGNRTQLLSVGSGEWGSEDNESLVRYPAVLYIPGAQISHQFRPNTSYVNQNGQTIVIGAGARAYPHYQPVHQTDLGTGNAKVDAALLFLLGMLPIKQGASKEEVFKLSRLRMMHPDPTPQTVKEIKQRLTGEHRAQVNSTDVILQIPAEAIEVFAEPVPSYYYLLHQGLFRSPYSTCFVVDIGGLTCLVQGFNEFGPMGEEGQVRLNMGGVKDLATRIGTAIEMSKLLQQGNHAKAEIIMNGLEEAHLNIRRQVAPIEGSSQKYRYNNGRNSFYFDHLAAPNLAAWCKQLLGEYMAKAASFPDWEATAFVGGGAYYIAPALKRLNDSGYFSPSSPELCNIRGLRLLGDPAIFEKLGAVLPFAA